VVNDETLPARQVVSVLVVGDGASRRADDGWRAGHRDDVLRKQILHGDPGEVITDRAPALANVIEELVPAAWHNTGQYENNRVEGDHGRPGRPNSRPTHGTGAGSAS